MRLISLRTGAVGEGWLPKTAEAMAWECQRAPAREAEAASKQWQRLPYSRCAFERVAHLVAEHYGQRRQAVERELVQTMPLPKEAHSARVLYGESEGASALAAWRLLLLNEPDAVDRVLQTLRDSGKENVRFGDGRPVHEAITYLQNHRADMNYAQARSLGLPVGSGNVEATCKSLFEVRLKRPGCRWKESTGAQIVDLRALALSDRYAQGIGLALAPLRVSVCPVSVPRTKLSCAA